MLFKKTVLLLAYVGYAYAAPLQANQTDTTHWTGKELELYNLLNQSFEPNTGASFHKDNTSLSGYEKDGDVQAYFVNCSPEWIDKAWDFTIKIWEKWGNADRENAKSCVKQMINLVKNRCGSNVYIASTGTCYCGAFFGDKVNGPGVADGAMEEVVNNLDKLGMSKTGYVVEANIGSRKDERFGVAINCANGQGWVSDKIAAFSADHETTGFSQSTFANWYGAITRPNA
ncbi:uncharacterized protein BX664DRAFT_342011 [Halteromyces radiatus]|uniref:uncharacterized protein n=1 Tax=Halteromyces radiatus TaxID=101107 RepID=UPI00221EEC80|nr:uncharacterized protein BX664DRAFT_342011 [Halteromyces radiatus]KAI8079993.1 hypothetical protein BX664DRAFT_342011 [Halteromyces radiatus]